MPKPNPEKQRVALMPCGGIGQVISTVIRRASILAWEEASDRILLVNSPAAAAGDEDEIQNLHEHPVLAVDGCLERCGAKLLDEIGVKDYRVLFAPETLAKHRLSLSGVSRSTLGEKGRKIADVFKGEIFLILLEVGKRVKE